MRVISVPDAQASGTVVRALKGSDGLADGAEITLQISDGSGYTAPDTSDSNTHDSGNGNNGESNSRNNGRSNGRGNRNPQPLISQDDIDDFTNELRRTFGFN